MRLAVQDHGGQGPTVLLVHGYPDDHHVWDLVVDRLLPDHRVVTYDVRGAGHSERPAGTADYRLELLVTDIAAVIDDVSPDEPVHLVAHDWGSIQGWSAVVDGDVAKRIAGYTSMSGPGLDHVANWMAARRRPGLRRWGQAARQGLHSWYIVAFHTPLAPRAFKAGLGRRWAKVLERSEGIRSTDGWPGDVTADAIAGMRLYRANIFRHRRNPNARTEVPVQLVIPTRDPYVGPRLLDGIEAIAPDLVRVEIDAKHWIPRSHPDEVARLIRAHVARVVERRGRTS
ncbi:MAG: alpha/beta fold hydrolase [Acidimicrobiales bacterium]|nr:alpha/beta fold hydrolase [Acidimicrobiales bacterium]